MPDDEQFKEFLPFLDAVSKSGERTRRVMYVFILLIVFIVSAIRIHDYPAWPKAQLKTAFDAISCIDNNSFRTNCGDLLVATKALPGFSISDDSELKSRIREKAGILQRRYVELQSFQLPFFGGMIHGNDLWIVSGLLFISMLAIYNAHLRRDGSNLEIAAKYAYNPKTNNLLLMTQIFVSATRDPINDLNEAFCYWNRLLCSFCST